MTPLGDRSPNSDNTTADNPFAQPAVRANLPLAKPGLNKRVVRGQAQKQRERRAEDHPELFDEQGDPRPGHVAPLVEGEGINNGFVAHPDMDKIEEMRKRSEEAAARSAAASATPPAAQPEPPAEPDVSSVKTVGKIMDSESDSAAQPADKVQDKTPDTLDGWFGKREETRKKWTAAGQMGKQAENSALRHFRRELSKLKSVIYIEGDIAKALDKHTIRTHIEKFGAPATCAALQDYLDMILDMKELRMTQQKDKSPDTVAELSPAESYLQTTKTMMGIALADIVTELNRPYPAQALFDVPKNKRAPKDAKGVKPSFVHARVEQIFGAENIGWRFATHPNSAVHYGEETETKKQEQTGELIDTVWYVVRVEMFIFQYAVFTADGSMDWIAGTPLSDTHKNMDRVSAYRGAMSSLLKQVIGRMGGFKAIRGQMGAEQSHTQQPQQPSTEKPADTSQQVGLTTAELKQFFEWTDGLKIPRGEVIGMLGLTDWKQHKGGLAAAKAKIDEATKVKA